MNSLAQFNALSFAENLAFVKKGQQDQLDAMTKLCGVQKELPENLKKFERKQARVASIKARFVVRAGLWNADTSLRNITDRLSAKDNARFQKCRVAEAMALNTIMIAQGSTEWVKMMNSPFSLSNKCYAVV